MKDYKSKMILDNCPGLVFDAKDIDPKNPPKIDSHLHTSWTDGADSVREVYDAASKAQLTHILYSEHSRKTSVDWFSKFADEVRSLPNSPCQAYVGTEVKIESYSGAIDTVDEISDQCDFIMASVHRFVDEEGQTIQFADTDPNEAVDREYALTWAALSNPKVDILGHMFGMSYKRFGVVPSEQKIMDLIAKAAEHDVAVEVNSNYHPSALKMIKWCQECEAKITFGSNAHQISEVGAIVRQLKMESLDA